MTIRLYPSEQLGNAQASLEQLSAGAIHIYSDDVAYIDKWSPALRWTSAPFLFKDRDHLLRFFASDYMDSLIARVEEAAGVTVIGDVGPLLRGPYRVLVSTMPVKSVADVDNLKLRIWDNQLVVDVWSALGAEVRVLGFSDVYQAIQTGVLDALSQKNREALLRAHTEAGVYSEEIVHSITRESIERLKGRGVHFFNDLDTAPL